MASRCFTLFSSFNARQNLLQQKFVEIVIRFEFELLIHESPSLSATYQPPGENRRPKPADKFASDHVEHRG
jgi:hypothetical protein